MNRIAVCLSVAALAALSLPLRAEELDRKGAQKLGWKLTLQSWTNNQKTVFDSIDLCKELGVRYLECYPGQRISPADEGKLDPNMTDTQIKEVLDKAKSCGVTIIDYGVTGISGNEKEGRKIFDWAKKMGITILVSEPNPKDLPAINKMAGEYGIRVAIHDHPKGSSRYWNPDYTYEQIKDLKNVGFCADVGHWKRSGLDPVEVLKKYGGKVFSLHFKDLVPDANGKGLHDVPWGTGDSKAAEMLAVLKEKGFRGPIAIEYESRWDVPALEKCVKFFFDEANKLAAG
jgi:sugar phosphate isomerase/epimerase